MKRRENGRTRSKQAYRTLKRSETIAEMQRERKKFKRMCPRGIKKTAGNHFNAERNKISKQKLIIG